MFDEKNASATPQPGNTALEIYERLSSQYCGNDIVLIISTLREITAERFREKENRLIEEAKNMANCASRI